MIHNNNKTIGAVLIGTLFATVIVNSSYAAGYFRIGHSLKKGHRKHHNEIGFGEAGTVAEAEDPSTIFFNPAGMSYLSGTQVHLGSTVYNPSIRFKNNGSLDNNNNPMQGGNGKNAGVTVPTPAFFVSHQINDRWHVGLGVTTPFGFMMKYSDGWVGRYSSTSASLVTLDINPSVSFKINDQVQIGGGISAQFIQTKASKAVDFGAIINPALSQKADGKAHIKGHGWGEGFNLGALWNITSKMRLGLAYRSNIFNNKIKNMSATFDNAPPPLVAATGAFQATKASTRVALPESYSVGVSHDLNEKWKVFSDFNWMKWSRLRENRVHFNNPHQPDDVVLHKFKNSWMLSLASFYKLTDSWGLTMGVTYTKSPVRSQFREVVFPETDAIGVGLGAGYKISKDMNISINYMRVTNKKANINYNAAGNLKKPFVGTLKGSYKMSMNIFGIHLNWKL